MGDHDKGRAVRILLQRYARERGPHGPRRGDPVCSAGIGDGLNDLPMLRSVDRPFLVRRPGGRFDDDADFPGLARTRGEGPAGWNEAVMALLDEIGPAAPAAGKGAS
jgi:predicted mannosyl-3-phosphoglycerate phosphatase (HAD superfamily)